MKAWKFRSHLVISVTSWIKLLPGNMSLGKLASEEQLIHYHEKPQIVMRSKRKKVNYVQLRINFDGFLKIFIVIWFDSVKRSIFKSLKWMTNQRNYFESKKTPYSSGNRITTNVKTSTNHAKALTMLGTIHKICHECLIELPEGKGGFCPSWHIYELPLMTNLFE